MRTWILLVLLLAGFTGQASPVENLPKAEVIKVDRSELRFTVKMTTGETRIIQITSETRFFKDGKYAVSEDIAAGDTVSGKVHKRADGIYEAVRIVILKAKTPAVAAATLL